MYEFELDQAGSYATFPDGVPKLDEGTEPLEKLGNVCDLGG